MKDIILLAIVEWFESKRPEYFDARGGDGYCIDGTYDLAECAEHIEACIKNEVKDNAGKD